MIRRMSISVRLAFWYACISFCGIVIFGTIMWFVLGKAVLSWKDRTLEMRASRVNSLLSMNASSNTEEAARRLNDLVGVLPEGELIQIVDIQSHRLFPSTGAEMLTLPGHGCKASTIQNAAVHQEYFRVLCEPILYQGRQAYLLVPSSLIEDQILSRTLASRLFQIAPLLLIISGIGGYSLSRRALRPVDALTEEAKGVTARDLSRRLPIPPADDELRRLALEWNSLLKRIETSLKRIEQFTADASHELRSPIAFIRATAQDSLSHGKFDQETKEALQVIVEETIDTGKLLEDLLLLARADAGEQTKFIEAVSLDEMLAEVHDRVLPQALAKSHTLTFPEGKAPSPRLLVYGAHLRQILGIVLDNAIKFTSHGGNVRVSYCVAEDLRVFISDDGIGISPEHQPFLFDRFYQVDPARTGNSGSGLGLSIAKSLLDRYSGTIKIESALHGGTSVTLTLPLSVLAHQ